MISIEELEKLLNQGSLSSIYLLYGEEKYLIENDVKKIKKIFGELIKGIKTHTWYVVNPGFLNKYYKQKWYREARNLALSVIKG